MQLPRCFELWMPPHEDQWRQHLWPCEAFEKSLNSAHPALDTAARNCCSMGVGSISGHGSGTETQVANRALRRRCDLVAARFSIPRLLLPTLAAMCSTKVLNTSSVASVTPNPTDSTCRTSPLPPTSATCVRDCAFVAMIQRTLMRLECSGLGYM